MKMLSKQLAQEDMTLIGLAYYHTEAEYLRRIGYIPTVETSDPSGTYNRKPLPWDMIIMVGEHHSGNDYTGVVFTEV